MTDRSANDIDARIGANVRKARERRGITKTSLAVALGVSPQMMDKFERGISRLAARQLFIISNLVGRTMDGLCRPRKD